jgi:hypothetical protein
MNIPPHFPETMDAEPARKGSLVCWQDKDRFCGPDCMAYIESPDGPDYAGKQWANCHILVNEHRTGKHLTILVQIGTELVKQRKNEAADRSRMSQPAPPKVL